MCLKGWELSESVNVEFIQLSGLYPKQHNWSKWNDSVLGVTMHKVGKMLYQTDINVLLLFYPYPYLVSSNLQIMLITSLNPKCATSISLYLFKIIYIAYFDKKYTWFILVRLRWTEISVSISIEIK